MSAKRILVVEDDPDVRKGMQLRLQANHFETCFAVDAVSVIGAVRQHKPDLILLDLGLPAGDGFMVMERLKIVPGSEFIPVIVVSGRTGRENRMRAMKAGARAFLEKPVDSDELLAVIRQALGEPVTIPSV